MFFRTQPRARSAHKKKPPPLAAGACPVVPKLVSGAAALGGGC
jgi:hypothetical protein